MNMSQLTIVSSKRIVGDDVHARTHTGDVPNEAPTDFHYFVALVGQVLDANTFEHRLHTRVRAHKIDALTSIAPIRPHTIF